MAPSRTPIPAGVTPMIPITAAAWTAPASSQASPARMESNAARERHEAGALDGDADAVEREGTVEGRPPSRGRGQGGQRRDPAPDGGDPGIDDRQGDETGDGAGAERHPQAGGEQARRQADGGGQAPPADHGDELDDEARRPQHARHSDVTGEHLPGGERRQSGGDVAGQLGPPPEPDGHEHGKAVPEGGELLPPPEGQAQAAGAVQREGEDQPAGVEPEVDLPQLAGVAAGRPRSGWRRRSRASAMRSPPRSARRRPPVATSGELGGSPTGSTLPRPGGAAREAARAGGRAPGAVGSACRPATPRRERDRTLSGRAWRGNQRGAGGVGPPCGSPWATMFPARSASRWSRWTAAARSTSGSIAPCTPAPCRRPPGARSPRRPGSPCACGCRWWG